MLNRIKKVLVLLLIITLPLILAGCGSNLLSWAVQKADETQIDALSTSLDNAKTKEDFTKIRTNATTILQTDPNNVEANLILGQSILGEQNVTPIDLLIELMDFDENTSTGSVFSIIEDALIDEDGNRVATKDLNEAADAFNRAASNNASISSSNQVARGVANTLAASAILSEVYTIEDDGSLTPKLYAGDADQEKKCLNTLIQNGFLTYANAAANAYDAADVLDEDAQEDTDKMKEQSDKVELLNAAINDTGPAYTYGTPAKTVDETSSDAEIGAAMDDIFED